jgi:hypothetical protein
MMITGITLWRSPLSARTASDVISLIRKVAANRTDQSVPSGVSACSWQASCRIHVELRRHDQRRSGLPCQRYRQTFINPYSSGKPMSGPRRRRKKWLSVPWLGFVGSITEIMM